MENNLLDLVIIGAGPAGVTAAIYAKRANLNFEIFEKYIIGGQVVNAFEIENYPGFNKILGSDLAFSYINQFKYQNIKVKFEEIIKITEISNHFYELSTNTENKYYAKNIILALGANPRKISFNSNANIERYISYCATCDGNFYKNKDVLVIGGGDSSITESIYLSNIVKNVIISSRSQLRADKSNINKISTIENVVIYENTLVDYIEEKENGLLVTIKNKYNNETKSLYVDGIFVYAGLLPQTSFLSNLNILNENGYVIVNNEFETVKEGLYAIGDCIQKDLRQIVTAESDGAIAIHSIISKKQ